MSISAEQPDVVQLPAEEQVAPPAHNRRAAAQRVREARDRLTSTTGTRPAFDRELLRQYAQTRLSASYFVMLLVGVTGLLFGISVLPRISKADNEGDHVLGEPRAWRCCWKAESGEMDAGV